MAGLTLRDVFIKDGDLFPGCSPPPPQEPDADCENREEEYEEPEGHDCPEDDECPACQGLEEKEGCGKAGRRGACGHCEDCADYGDMKYHEKVDREIERMSDEDFQKGRKS